MNGLHAHLRALRGRLLILPAHFRIALEAFRAWRALKYAPIPLLDFPRYFGRWSASLASGGSPMKDRRPWLTFAAIDFLDRNIGPGDAVFEWGMGGSSLFFARRAGRVVSIEHEAEWCAAVRSEMAHAGIGNWEGFLIGPDPLPPGPGLSTSDPEDYCSNSPSFAKNTFRAYASFIDRYPDLHFDVVLVDGRARPSCIRHAAAKTRRLLVVDNAERENYRPACEWLRRAGWTQRCLAGFLPYNSRCSSTDVWTRASTRE